VLLVSSSTRFVEPESKATKRPSADTEEVPEWPFPSGNTTCDEALATAVVRSCRSRTKTSRLPVSPATRPLESESKRKNGTTKAVYLDRSGPEAKARELLAGARSAAEIACRQVVLLAMARYADEEAIAQSQRSFHTLSPGRQLPFSGEVIDQLDAITAEKLPTHVLDRGREDRQRQAAERAKDREDQAWLQQQYEALEAMSAAQREAVLTEHEERFGSWGGQRWQLEQRIRELAEAEAPPPDETDDPAPGTHREGGEGA